MAVLALEPADLGCVGELIDVEKEAHSDSWTGKQFEQEIQLPRAHFFVARRGKEHREIAAYGGFWQVGNEAEIMKVTVKKGFRRCGIGTWLLGRLEEKASEFGCNLMRLEVRSDNRPARRLYLKMGFEEKGIRKKYYQGICDAVLMEKHI